MRKATLQVRDILSDNGYARDFIYTNLYKNCRTVKVTVRNADAPFLKVQIESRVAGVTAKAIPANIWGRTVPNISSFIVRIPFDTQPA